MTSRDPKDGVRQYGRYPSDSLASCIFKKLLGI